MAADGQELLYTNSEAQDALRIKDDRPTPGWHSKGFRDGQEKPASAGFLLPKKNWTRPGVFLAVARDATSRDVFANSQLQSPGTAKSLKWIEWSDTRRFSISTAGQNRSFLFGVQTTNLCSKRLQCHSSRQKKPRRSGALLNQVS